MADGSSNGRPSLFDARISRRGLFKTAAISGAALALQRTGLTPAFAGPSTPTLSYLSASAAGVTFDPILTAGDSVGGYRMVGLPDGLGAYSTGSEFVLVMHHELDDKQGVTRAHGSIGSFNSRWTINRYTREVTSGRDLDKTVYQWIGGKYVKQTTIWNRFCSADLPELSAFSYGGLGTTERIFMGGEESGATGRAWAHIVTGPNANQAWELPLLGHRSFENVLACPSSRQKTVVAALDDKNGGGVAVYVGQKQATGSEIEKAGLTNGKLYSVQVLVDGQPVAEETNGDAFGDGSYVGKATFVLAEAETGTGFLRPEDGAWDPRAGSGPDGRPRGNDFYFVTTNSFSGNSRLFRLSFYDLNQPEAGGTIEVVINGGPQHMFDNICIDGLGRIMLQEDPGGTAYLARIWCYGIDSGELVEVAQANPAFFYGSQLFLTTNEESSGIIDASAVLGNGWYLLVVQAHFDSPDEELVEGGQLIAMYVPPSIGI